MAKSTESNKPAIKNFARASNLGSLWGLVILFPLLWFCVAFVTIPRMPTALLLCVFSALLGGIIGAVVQIQRAADKKSSSHLQTAFIATGFVIPGICIALGLAYQGVTALLPDEDTTSQQAQAAAEVPKELTLTPNDILPAMITNHAAQGWRQLVAIGYPHAIYTYDYDLADGRVQTDLDLSLCEGATGEMRRLSNSLNDSMLDIRYTFGSRAALNSVPGEQTEYLTFNQYSNSFYLEPGPIRSATTSGRRVQIQMKVIPPSNQKSVWVKNEKELWLPTEQNPRADNEDWSIDDFDKEEEEKDDSSTSAEEQEESDEDETHILWGEIPLREKGYAPLKRFVVEVQFFHPDQRGDPVSLEELRQQTPLYPELLLMPSSKGAKSHRFGFLEGNIYRLSSDEQGLKDDSYELWIRPGATKWKCRVSVRCDF